MTAGSIARMAAAGLVAALALAPGPADAATATKQDSRGDGRSGVDFRSFRVDNGTTRTTMALTVARLPRKGVVFLSFVDPIDGEYGGGVRVRRAKGVVRARYYNENYEGMTTSPCPGTGATWSTRKDRVTATFDWSCAKYGPYDANYFYAQWGRDYDRSDHLGSFQVARD
jgi:hypothetical protein